MTFGARALCPMTVLVSQSSMVLIKRDGGGGDGGGFEQSLFQSTAALISEKYASGDSPGP